MNEKIKLIQQVELEALKEWDKYCAENNLSFYLRGGSVLGAVKYNGFIPWDDDLDIAMPREDYERMIELMELDNTISNKFIVNSYRYCKKLHCYFPRMVLKEEERIRLGLPKTTKLGLHLMDIFPLDGAPNTVLSRLIFCAQIYYYRALASVGTVYESGMVNMHSKKQQLVVDFLRLLGVDKKVNQIEIYGKLERLYTRYNSNKQKYVGTPTASLFTKEIMPQSIWGDGVWMKFVDIEVRVPTDYDTYCKRLYGKKYLYTEPDVKKRKSHLG